MCLKWHNKTKYKLYSAVYQNTGQPQYDNNTVIEIDFTQAQTFKHTY